MEISDSKLRWLDDVALGSKTVPGFDTFGVEEQVLIALGKDPDLAEHLSGLKPGQPGYTAAQTVRRIRNVLASPMPFVELNDDAPTEEPGEEWQLSL